MVTTYKHFHLKRARVITDRTFRRWFALSNFFHNKDDGDGQRASLW